MAHWKRSVRGKWQIIHADAGWLFGGKRVSDSQGDGSDPRNDPEIRLCGRYDRGNLFEGDVIYNPEHRTVRMEICYGKYAAYCPNDQEYMETVGFYMVSNTTDDAMPLGPTKEYALLLGNVVDNPEIKVV